MASDSIPFILFILSNSFRLSYALSERHNHIPQLSRYFFATARFGARIPRIPTTMSVDRHSLAIPELGSCFRCGLARRGHAGFQELLFGVTTPGL